MFYVNTSVICVSYLSNKESNFIIYSNIECITDFILADTLSFKTLC